MMAYLAAFCDMSAAQGAMMCLTLFQRGLSAFSLSHSPTSSPALNSPTAQL